MGGAPQYLMTPHPTPNFNNKIEVGKRSSQTSSLIFNYLTQTSRGEFLVSSLDEGPCRTPNSPPSHNTSSGFNTYMKSFLLTVAMKAKIVAAMINFISRNCLELNFNLLSEAPLMSEYTQDIVHSIYSRQTLFFYLEFLAFLCRHILLLKRQVQLRNANRRNSKLVNHQLTACDEMEDDST